VEPASERSANTSDIQNICFCECYGCYSALIILREVFWSRPRAESWFWPEDQVLGNIEIARGRMNQLNFNQNGLSPEFWTGLGRGPG
jgi:hypothetical protein